MLLAPPPRPPRSPLRPYSPRVPSPPSIVVEDEKDDWSLLAPHIDEELPQSRPITLLTLTIVPLTPCVDELPTTIPSPQPPLIVETPEIDTNAVSTSPQRSHTLVECITDEILSRAPFTYHRCPLPPQYRFACHPVIVPRPVASHNQFLVPRNFVPRTSLMQFPPISLPRTPVTIVEPLTTVSTPKRAEDLQITHAAEELPPPNASRTIDQAMDEDTDERSLLTSCTPVSPFPLASTLVRIDPTNETPLINKETIPILSFSASNAPLPDQARTVTVLLTSSSLIDVPTLLRATATQTTTNDTELLPAKTHASSGLRDPTTCIAKVPLNSQLYAYTLLVKHMHVFEVREEQPYHPCKRPCTQLMRCSVPLSWNLSDHSPDSAHLTPFVKPLRLLPAPPVSTDSSRNALVARDDSNRVRDPSTPPFSELPNPVPSLIIVPPPLITAHSIDRALAPVALPSQSSVPNPSMFPSLGTVSHNTDLSGPRPPSFLPLDPSSLAPSRPPPQRPVPLCCYCPSLLPSPSSPLLLGAVSQSPLVVMEDNTSKRGVKTSQLSVSAPSAALRPDPPGITPRYSLLMPSNTLKILTTSPRPPPRTRYAVDRTIDSQGQEIASRPKSPPQILLLNLHSPITNLTTPTPYDDVRAYNVQKIQNYHANPKQTRLAINEVAQQQEDARTTPQQRIETWRTQIMPDFHQTHPGPHCALCINPADDRFVLAEEFAKLFRFSFCQNILYVSESRLLFLPAHKMRENIEKYDFLYILFPVSAVNTSSILLPSAEGQAVLHLGSAKLYWQHFSWWLKKALSSCSRRHSAWWFKHALRV
ncbi:hypothetical protein EDB92DRAFT_1967350 [Lactarius akahatsu]|uniref:Uncharacterized protein n=1 Tax=Lactarius akahatsu TaxID=416441 RepID=A0AAD4LPB5_9AGAM|nr:hypothetical protein EDB92DRAFT_1967350 [Lactarius akahatsu]